MGWDKTNNNKSIHIEPKNHEIVCANKKEVDQGPWSISSVSLMCILIRSKPPSFQSPQCTRHGKTFDTRISYPRFFLRSRPRQQKLPWYTSGRVHL